MRLGSLLLCFTVCACTSAAPAAEPAPRRVPLPTVKVLQALIGKTPKAAPRALAGLVEADTWRLSHTIGETADGHVIAIGVATTTYSEEEIEAEREYWHGWSGTYADELVTPLVFVFRRQPDQTLVPLGGLRLPTHDSPHSRFAWGFAKIDDVDGDGRPELAVVYGYESYVPGSTYSSTTCEEITWVAINDGKLTVQANLRTEEFLDDFETPNSQVTYRLVPQKGTVFNDLHVTTEASNTKTTAVWAYDAAQDAWLAK